MPCGISQYRTRRLISRTESENNMSDLTTDAVHSKVLCFTLRPVRETSPFREYIPAQVLGTHERRSFCGHTLHSNVNTSSNTAQRNSPGHKRRTDDSQLLNFPRVTTAESYNTCDGFSQNENCVNNASRCIKPSRT